MQQAINLLRRNNWLCQLFRVSVFVFWILVPTGFGNHIITETRKEISYQRSRDIRQEANDQLQLVNFAKKKVVAAKKSGRLYGPKQYFADLREIERTAEQYKTSPRASLQINQLHHQLDSNVRTDVYSHAEVRKYADKFKTYRLDDSRLEFAKQLRDMGLYRTVCKILCFYLVSAILIILIYLARLAERELDERFCWMRFVLAVVFWPGFFWRYPFNILKELWVEAQIRRIGPLFRRLSLQEQTAVRKVGTYNQQAYTTWLAGFQTSHQAFFRRGVLTAILGTLIIQFLSIIVFPTPVNASSRQSSNSTITISVRDGPTTNERGDNDGDTPAVIPIRYGGFITQVLWELSRWHLKVPHWSPLQIDVIPKTGYLVPVFTD